MRFPSRQPSVEGLPGVSGTARLDRRTSSLLRRVKRGDVAVIDHLDLDRATAERLVDAGVAAVVNAAPSISGRYPNLGPEVLVRAGIPLLDDVGPDVFGALKDGTEVRLNGELLLAGEDLVAKGRRLEPDDVAALMDDARSGLSTQLQSFTHNTTEFLRREQELLLNGQGIPTTRTPIEGRPVVVVVRDYDYREDLRRLRRFIREQRPVLVGVDGGADALIAAGHRPDLVVIGEEGLAASEAGEQGVRGASASRTVSDKALRTAREVVLHADRSGRAVGADRLERLGVRHQTVAASGTSEDVGLLLADVRGASTIVAVGTHATLDEFLDRQRSGLASTFLTRLRIGPKLVDAKRVPELYAGRVRIWHLLVVLLAGLVALAVAIAATPVGADWWASIGSTLSDVLDRLQGLFP